MRNPRVLIHRGSNLSGDTGQGQSRPSHLIARLPNRRAKVRRESPSCELVLTRFALRNYFRGTILSRNGVRRMWTSQGDATAMAEPPAGSRSAPAVNAAPAVNTERTLISPAKPWIPLNLSELWARRSLLGLLLLDEVRKSYVGTWLGVAWLFLQPLLTALVFALVFSLFARMPTNGLPALLFYLSGLVPWMFFAGALTRSVKSISGEAAMLKKVYFPRAL